VSFHLSVATSFKARSRMASSLRFAEIRHFPLT
jgi:hypothetical protein